MIESIEQFDHALSLAINQLNAPVLDQLMILISAKLTWIPLYALLLFLLVQHYGWRTTVYILIGVAGTIFLTDQISVFMKNEFARYRPCHNLILGPQLSTPDGCGGTFGFVSSHAANTMGLAIYISYLLKKKWVYAMMMSFALLNSYSRVYLAKHYVSDVIGGMILGLILGLIVFFAIQKLIALKESKE